MCTCRRPHQTQTRSSGVLLAAGAGGRDGPVVNVFTYQSIAWAFKSRQGQKFWFESSAPPAPLANSAMMSLLTAHCQWVHVHVDETLRKMTIVTMQVS